MSKEIKDHDAILSYLINGIIKDKNIDPKSWRKSRKIYIPKPPENIKNSEVVDSNNRAEIFAPLDAVFIDDLLKDDIVTKTGIPELVEGKTPNYSGVILYGPPGTGKTVLLSAIEEVYKRSGAYTKSCSISQLNSSFVSQLASNLEREILTAIEEAKKRGKPSFIWFDEASILAQSAKEGASSVSKHYQEAIDVMKKYIGNHRELVVGIATNELPEFFEEALVREGRLTPIFIGYPDETQKKRMWQYFGKQYELVDLTDEQAGELGELTGREQGAFIEEFCRGYLGARRQAILKEKGFASLVQALKQNVNVSEQDARSTINYEQFSTDVKYALERKYSRNGNSAPKEETKIAGFKPQGE